MVSKLDHILAMGINNGDDIGISNESGTPYPYLQYDQNIGGGEEKKQGDKLRPKTGKKSSSSGGMATGGGSSRPKSASRSSKK